jgi:hypothetical protein
MEPPRIDSDQSAPLSPKVVEATVAKGEVEEKSKQVVALDTRVPFPQDTSQEHLEQPCIFQVL